MAQPAEKKGGGKNPLNIVAFWEVRTPEPPVYWEEWIIKFHWGMIAKYDIDPDDFYFANTLNAAAVGALPEEVNGKNRLDSEKKLKSNLYLCIGDEAQRIFKARKPTVNIKTERYPRVLDEMQNVFQRERNVTHERGLFYGRKQRENETFEKFHAELSALAGRCDFANAAENVRDIFIMNMRESDCQRELSRSTKLPEEVYRNALSNERGERAYKSYTGRPASTAPAISIKQEPVSNIRRGQGFFEVADVGDVEDTPKDQVVVEEAEIIVGVTIATHQILPWIILRAVLQEEQHVTHAENWVTLNEHAEELEEVLTIGGDEDESDWLGRKMSTTKVHKT